MDWIGEAMAIVFGVTFGVTTLVQRAKTKRAKAAAEVARLAAEQARADARRLAADLERIRVEAGTDR